MWEASFIASSQISKSTSYSKLLQQTGKWFNLCRNAHLCVYSTSRYGPFKIRSQIGRITGFNLPNFSSNEAWHRSDYLHLHWEDKCGKPWLTYCLWRRTSVLLLCRREQHRSCLWVGRCPCPSGSSGSPCPCWTHWKPSTCRLETEGEKKKRWEEGRQKTKGNVEAWEAAIVANLVSDGNLLLKKTNFPSSLS